MTQSQLNADWISPPSESIARIAQINPEGLKEFLNLSSNNNIDGSGVVQNRVKITQIVATSLAISLGSTSEFWLERSRAYEEALTTRAQTLSGSLDTSIFEMDILSYFDHEFSRIEYGKNDFEKILHFFAIGTADELTSKYLDFGVEVDFHTSQAYSSENGAIAVWIRSVEQKSIMQQVCEYNESALTLAIPEMRSLVKLRKPSLYFEKLKSILNRCGIRLVYLPHPKKCPVSGVLIRRENEPPTIAVTFRYLSDDHFWFTFFHEIGHLLDNNSATQNETILLTEGEINSRENFADEYAYRVLIPENLEKALQKVALNKKAVIRLAIQNQLSPGIVVGQLQHMKRIPMSWMNGLKRRYTRSMLSSLLNESL